MAAKNKGTSAKKDMASWKPGSEPEKAKEIGGDGDFGVPMGDGPSADRDYVSRNTKMSDPGASQPFAWEKDGVRDHGAGARAVGPGSASGGDLDPDFIGVGTGGSGVSTSGPGDAPGADDVEGTSDAFASGAPAKRESRPYAGPAPSPGSFVSKDPDLATTPMGQGSDPATNPARDDDSFAGEVTFGEAIGEDNPMEPSSDMQG